MNPSLPTLTLDELTALNEEIIALSRAGVPLEMGLREMGRDLPGKIGAAARILGERLESGERLDRVFASTQGLPPAYAAIVEAGLRSGRLSSALSSVASVMRRVAELRRVFAAAMVYPLVIVTLAYLLALFTLTNYDIGSLTVFESLGATPSLPIQWVTALKNTMPYWAAFPPLIGLVVVVAGVLRLRTAPAAATMKRYRLPTIRRMVRDGRLFAFLEVLTLLVEHGAPLDEAIRLAASATGDKSLAQAGGEIAERIRSGMPLDSVAAVPRGFPPLLGWLLLSGRQQKHMVSSLRRMSASYKSRATRTAAFLSIYVPLLISSLVGGFATLAYAFLALGPWYHLLFRLGIQP